MAAVRLILVLVSIWGPAAGGEASERPDIRIPEPVRQELQTGAYHVVAVRYHAAVPEHDVLMRAMPELIRYVRESTDISARIAFHYAPLYSDRVADALLLYMIGV